MPPRCACADHIAGTTEHGKACRQGGTDEGGNCGGPAGRASKYLDNGEACFQRLDSTLIQQQ